MKMYKFKTEESAVFKPILDIYNNASYELIPYKIKNDLKVAHPWVIQRFFYIQIWNLLAAYSIKSIELNSFTKYVGTIMEKIKKNKLDWNDLPELYFGTYENETQSYKKILKLDLTTSKIYC